MSKSLSALSKRASLLVALQAGDYNAAREFDHRYTKFFYSLATRLSYGSREIAEDIVGQAFYLLCLRTRKPFDPNSVSSTAYIEAVVLMAARDVRDSVTPPGQKKRQQNQLSAEKRRIVGCFRIIEPTYSELTQSKMKPLCLDDVSHADVEGTLGETIRDHTAVSPERKALNEDAVGGLLSEAFRTAPKGVSEVLSAVYYEDKSLTDAAKSLGFEHTTIRRRIDRWVHQNPHLREYTLPC